MSKKTNAAKRKITAAQKRTRPRRLKKNLRKNPGYVGFSPSLKPTTLFNDLIFMGHLAGAIARALDLGYLKTPERHGTKTAQILDLLKRPGGASLKELMKATGWQAHSIRGFLSGTVGKKMGLRVMSIKGEDGERRYSVKAPRRVK